MNMIPVISPPHDLHNVKEFVYDKCGFEFRNLKLNTGSLEYSACSFELNGQSVEYRCSKITPKKIGQFVTTWKRNASGVTEPFDISDGLDLIIITSKTHNKMGQFVFPTSVLADKGIIMRDGKEGKRGIRVYAPWDVPINNQAKKTQSWQTEYFLAIESDRSFDPVLAKKLFDRKKS